MGVRGGRDGYTQLIHGKAVRVEDGEGGWGEAEGVEGVQG